MMVATATAANAVRSLRCRGFAILGRDDFQPTRLEWEDFGRLRSSWADLEVDGYLPDGGRYRWRRYSRVRVDHAGVEILPHRPFFQCLGISPAMGGIEKDFAPIPEAALRNSFFEENLRALCELFARCSVNSTAWLVDVHLFRVTCSISSPGFPIPAAAGLHREGKSFVSVQMIDRGNIVGGGSRVATDTGEIVLEHTLSRPLDSLLVDDRTMLHDALPIAVADATRSQSGHRDVLNMDFEVVGGDSGRPPPTNVIAGANPGRRVS